MRKNKLIKILTLASLLATVMTVITPIGTNAAWKQSNAEGSSWATGWKNINETWYYFDNDGYMKRGWLEYNGTWYYLDSNGEVKTGWVKEDDHSYFFKSDGTIARDEFIKDDGKIYFFQKNGVMRTGWTPKDGEICYLEKDGAMATGWREINGDRYYFDENGIPAKGIVTIENGETYYFNSLTNKLVKNADLLGLTTDSNGIVTNYSIDEAKESILTNDSSFIEKAKEEFGKIQLVEPEITSISKYLNDSSRYYQIDEEECIKFSMYALEKEEENRIGYYLVGLNSGKIYSISNKDGYEVYEIKNNEIVNSYEDENDNTSCIWR